MIGFILATLIMFGLIAWTIGFYGSLSYFGEKRYEPNIIRLIIILTPIWHWKYAAKYFWSDSLEKGFLSFLKEQFRIEE